jgi:hypothetical protein
MPHEHEKGNFQGFRGHSTKMGGFPLFVGFLRHELNPSFIITRF